MAKAKDVVEIQTTQKMSIMDLVELIESSLTHEQIPLFIALLDEAAQSWDVTRAVARHFIFLRGVDLEECKAQGEKAPIYSAKSITGKIITI